ncbi:unnamed protein product, partial [Amoebophrya sp. A120]
WPTTLSFPCPVFPTRAPARVCSCVLAPLMSHRPRLASVMACVPLPRCRRPLFAAVWQSPRRLPVGLLNVETRALRFWSVNQKVSYRHKINVDRAFLIPQ